MNSNELKNLIASVDAIEFIRLVQSHSLLYDREPRGYNDPREKADVWEVISQQLVPEYSSLSDEMKATLGNLNIEIIKIHINYINFFFLQKKDFRKKGRVWRTTSWGTIAEEPRAKKWGLLAPKIRLFNFKSLSW